ncbi:hypothetical protein Tco_1315254 [Tanacetum coccineum]
MQPRGENLEKAKGIKVVSVTAAAESFAFGAFDRSKSSNNTIQALWKLEFLYILGANTTTKSDADASMLLDDLALRDKQEFESDLKGDLHAGAIVDYSLLWSCYWIVGSVIEW